MRKLKLVEEDLDQSEDRATEATTKLRELEGQLEEAQRENKKLQKTVDTLEGQYAILLSLFLGRTWTCFCLLL